MHVLLVRHPLHAFDNAHAARCSRVGSGSVTSQCVHELRSRYMSTGAQLIYTDDTRLFQPVDKEAAWALALVLPG